jgi:hypothetical protein
MSGRRHRRDARRVTAIWSRRLVGPVAALAAVCLIVLIVAAAGSHSVPGRLVLGGRLGRASDASRLSVAPPGSARPLPPGVAGRSAGRRHGAGRRPGARAVAGRSGHHRSVAAVVRPALLVLNDSRIPHLAALAAAAFRRAGWPIRAIGNLPARTPQTTVYYGPGALAAAQRLQRSFPAVTAALPRPPGFPLLPLIVVVTRYWVDE